MPGRVGSPRPASGRGNLVMKAWEALMLAAALIPTLVIEFLWVYRVLR